ncbi:hypothetical protein NIES4073_27150 [Kalymmatonema gypsitolerans NIES-4073]|nr:hypothetical protein NIES4073_27150 [Scytonema sp. NIES-4073]
MREIGVIRCIAFNVVILMRGGKSDIAVRLDQVRYPQSELLQGTFVTFEVYVNPQTNLEVGKNLELLIDSTNESEKKQTILKITQILETYIPYERSLLLEKLPIWVKKHQAIFYFLSLDRKVAHQRPIITNRLQGSVKQHQELFNFLTPAQQIDMLVHHLKEVKESENDTIAVILKIAEIIKKSTLNERPLFLAKLPVSLKRHQAVFSLLTLHEQIELAHYSLEIGLVKLWQMLSPQAKKMCIHRAAKESENLSTILTTLKNLQHNNPENNLLVKCALKLLWTKEHPERGNEVFQQVDELLTQYVIEQAKSSTEFLELDPLLPYCQPTEVSVKYCEGKLWKTKEGTCAYCPRTRKRCELFEPNKRGNSNSDLYGARIYAECSQDWRNWSLLELFKVAGIEPSLPGLKIPEDYVPKLAGWVNRINEIRSRLKCSVCKEIMPHNIEYAKFTAQFRVTVFSCKHGSGHDYNIYLNECWGCGEIIDSRESKYQSPEDKYYICIHCGSGTQHSNNYTQGDICPKCGTLGMEVNKWNNRYRKCHSCNHLIKLPDEKKLTGPKCSKCGTKGMILLVNQNNEQIRACRSQSCELSINILTEQRVAEPQQWENDINF